MPNFTSTIRDWFVGNDGEYVCGLENGRTVVELLDIYSVPYDDLRLRIQGQGAFSSFMRIVRRHGYKAGGIGREPRIYFIAKNPSEERLLLLANIPMKLGHLQTIMQLAGGHIDTRQLKGATNRLLQFQSEVNASEAT